jgi:hypothetical protein
MFKPFAVRVFVRNTNQEIIVEARSQREALERAALMVSFDGGRVVHDYARPL